MDLYLAGTYSRPFVFEQYLRGGSVLDLYLAGGYTTGSVKSMWIDRLKEDDALCNKTINQRKFDEIIKGCSKNNVCDIAILESFYYADEFIEKLIPKLDKFMLDSGAFTFFSSGKKVDWNNYLEEYADFIKRNNVKLFYELDIDSLVGYEKVKEFRKILERETGKQCIPVWHKSRGVKEFYRMCDEYNYVAIGGIVSKEIKPNEYRCFPAFINEAHKRGTNIHGLGFTNLKGIEQYHFDSVDSTSWTSGNRFGAVYVFNGRTMEKAKKKDGQRLADSKAVAVNNFNEWVKFQQYAKTHL